MVDLIESGVEGILSTQHPLARLWRITLHTFRVRPDVWDSKLTKYQDKIARSNTTKGSANIKGNLVRSLAEDRISWNTIMHGLSIIGFDKLRIELHLTKEGVTTVVGLNIDNEEYVAEVDANDKTNEAGQ